MRRSDGEEKVAGRRVFLALWRSKTSREREGGQRVTSDEKGSFGGACSFFFV